MTIAISGTLYGAMASAVYDTVGANPTIDLLDAGGVVLVTFTLGASWATLTGSGSLSLSPVPITAVVAVSGTASSFKLKSSAGAVHISGSVATSAGDGDIIIDRVSLVSGIIASIISWRLYVA